MKQFDGGREIKKKTLLSEKCRSLSRVQFNGIFSSHIVCFVVPIKRSSLIKKRKRKRGPLNAITREKRMRKIGKTSTPPGG